MGKTGSFSGGQGLAQWSFDPVTWCWVRLCSLPDSFLAWGDPALESAVRLMGPPRGFLPRGTFPDCCCQCLHPCGDPLPTRAATGDPALAGGLVQSPGETERKAPFLWGLVQRKACSFPLRFCLCPPKTGVSVCPSPVEVLQSNPAGLQGQIARDSQSLCQIPGWEAWRGVQNLHNRGRTSLVLLFSSLWVTNLVGMGFDFTVIVPRLPSCCSFFVWRSQHPSVNGYSIASCDFGALAGGNECTSFYSAILNRKPTVPFLKSCVCFFLKWCGWGGLQSLDCLLWILRKRFPNCILYILFHKGIRGQEAPEFITIF